MGRPFVVVSGLPGSGKTTLARRLAPALGLQLIDKDDILERLFESKGVGDATWRRALSRESDVVLQNEAAASPGAVLTSMWHVPGMAAGSGTPTRWLLALSKLVVNVHCACSPEIAATRFMQRKRHVGHLDDTAIAKVPGGPKTHARLGALEIGPRVDVDTTGEPEIDTVVGEIRSALTRCLTRFAADGGWCDHEPPRLKPGVDMAVTCQVSYTLPVLTIVSGLSSVSRSSFIDRFRRHDVLATVDAADIRGLATARLLCVAELPHSRHGHRSRSCRP